MRAAAFAPIALAVTLLAGAARGQEAPPPAPPLPGLTGDWLGEGQLEGRPAVELLAVEWTLGGRFLRLVLHHQPLDPPGFEAQAFLRPEEGGRWSGTWLDSEGALLPLTAGPEGDQGLLLELGPRDGPRRLRLRLPAEGQLELTWLRETPAGWEEAGRLLLTRQRPGE